MGYEYIASNNLYEKQTYMYSEYRGMDFLRDYLTSRYQYMNVAKSADDGILPCVKDSEDAVQQDLFDILQKLKTGDYSREVINVMNAYTKSFEVRKRIYSCYDNHWKPVEDAGFENYQNYLLFADCLLHMYQHNKCLKYFSCLLKVNDTMLSVQDCLPECLRGYFSQIISQELDIFHQLVQENGMDGEVAG